TQTGAKVRTPNLARLIDENRILGWQSGQALAFMLDGDDNIGAVYPGGNAAGRARLVIVYHSGTGPNLDGVTNRVSCSVTPPSGVYSTAQLAVIACDEPGAVTYTLDGSDPGPGVGAPYTEPIGIGDGRTQLKVYAAGGIRDTGVLTYNYIVGPGGGEAVTTEAVIATDDDDALANPTRADLGTSSLSLHSQHSSSLNYDTYLRFTGLNLPADAVIASAALVFTASSSATAGGQIEVVGETSARGAFATAPGAFAGREWTQGVTLTAPKLSSGQTYTADGLGGIVAEQLSTNAERADWVFKIHGLTPSQALSVRSRDGSTSAAPRLQVSYYSNYADTTQVVSNNYDDAEELGAGGSIERSGSIQLGGYRTSSSSESTRDVAAFRFAAVAIPESATLVNAYIEFTTQPDGPSGRTSNLTIQAELGDAGSYPTTAGAITSRSYSLGQVDWQVEAFRQSRATARTPNLKNLIDEVRLGGWTSGGALAFKLDGDGFIGSVYSGPGADAARLYVEYRFDGAGAWENVVTDPAQIDGVHINELSTSGTAANEDDWAELYNGSDKFVWLGPQIRLWRDGTSKGDTFNFTGLLLPPHSYVILYADEDRDKGPNHLSFDFKKTGEVNLTDMSSGSPRVIDAFAYTEQAYLETHARQPDGGEIYLMAEDTYGYSNNAAPQKYPITFSHERGRYDTGFALTISSLPGVAIRYTTDGSTPSSTKGTLYTGPVSVAKTMAVRAVAYDAAGTSTAQTRTYVLLDNLKNEVAASNSRWTSANKATIDDAVYAEALNALPIVSISSDVVELSHSSSADYVQGYFEFMPEPGSGDANYAQPIGVKRFGQVSATRFNSGIAVRFKKDYGAGKAKYEFFKSFEGEPYELVGEYKKLELAEGQDGPQNDGISTHGYLRYSDMTTRLLANQMGNFDSHARYVHYFYNGQYAGIKTMREDYGAHTFEPYFDIDSDEFTKVSYQDNYFTSGDVEEGDGEVAVMQAVHAASASGDYARFESYVDVLSLIRTMILFRYIDTENEWNAVVQNSVGEGGMKMMFNVNDSDGAFYNGGRTTSTTYSGSILGGGGNYRYKWSSATSQAGPYNMFRTWTRYDTSSQTDGDLEFKTLVKDEVLKQIGPASGDFRGADGAPLSVDNVQAILLAQQSTLEVPYRLDAAYMGVANAWSKWTAYNPGVISLVEERTRFNLEQWSKIGLTHTLPEVESASAGAGFTLAVAASDTIIYYTLDGSDPLGQSGAIPGQSGANPAAQAYTAGTVVPAGAAVRAYTTGNWGPLTTVS
ncbi:MAG: chitobiase/beta-hexosaminidase C-terminal domain-containing protein, partial [Bifidobacteriaceae bacterium]|nr:chitobiase/beta-hexosaminidase C-terminal domain-containing protein [Bifidobacteriaceae bacterium]